MKQDPILQKLNNLAQLISRDERPLTLPEAAEYLGVSKSHLYKLTSGAKIAHFKPAGKKLYFRKSDLSAYLFRNKRTSENDLEQIAIDRVVNQSA